MKKAQKNVCLKHDLESRPRTPKLLKSVKSNKKILYASAHWSFFTSLSRCRGIGGLRPRNGIPENTGGGAGGGLGASQPRKSTVKIQSHENRDRLNVRTVVSDDMSCLKFRSRSFLSKFKGPSLLLNCKNRFPAGYFMSSIHAPISGDFAVFRVRLQKKLGYLTLEKRFLFVETCFFLEQDHDHMKNWKQRIDLSFSYSRDASNRRIASNRKMSRNCRYSSNTKKVQQQPVGQPQQRG